MPKKVRMAGKIWAWREEISILRPKKCEWQEKYGRGKGELAVYAQKSVNGRQNLGVERGN